MKNKESKVQLISDTKIYANNVKNYKLPGLYNLILVKTCLNNYILEENS